MLRKFRVMIWALLILIAFHTNDPVQATSFDHVQKVRLVWDTISDAVRYELVVTKEIGEAGKDPKPENVVFVDMNIYTAGTEMDVVNFRSQLESLYWQVRALDFDGQSISSFSMPEKLTDGEFDPIAPLPTVNFDKRDLVPLYPTYAWIPVLYADYYEVQVLSAQLDNDEASDYLINSYIIPGAQSFDCYGEDAFTTEGTWWWRVIAKAADGQSVGTWSKALPVTVRHIGYPVAALGDSVTHGGGAISNPSCNPAYDWTSYVGFPVRNLGHSGDTTEAMNSRFDADVLPFSPKILIVMGGVNDIRGGTSAEEVITHLKAIKGKCIENGIMPIFLTITPVNPAAIERAFGEATDPEWQREWHRVNAWIRSQPYYVDTASLLTGNDGLLPTKIAADGLHPDTKGKELIGRAVGEYLSRL